MNMGIKANILVQTTTILSPPPPTFHSTATFGQVYRFKLLSNLCTHMFLLNLCPRVGFSTLHKSRSTDLMIRQHADLYLNPYASMEELAVLETRSKHL